jgi:hypothetical protein
MFATFKFFYHLHFTYDIYVQIIVPLFYFAILSVSDNTERGILKD